MRSGFNNIATALILELEFLNILGETFPTYFAFNACPANAPPSLLSKSANNCSLSSGVNLANSACNSSSVSGGAQETKNMNIINNEIATNIFLIYNTLLTVE